MTRPVPIVLGVDPGNVSGWAIALDPETILEHGIAKRARERLRAVVTARRIARAHGRPLRVCMEWVTAGGGTARTAMGIGKGRGLWLTLFDLVLGVREERVLRADPRDWRKATHGVVKAPGADRKERERAFKAAAIAFTRIPEADAAEAACIAMWAAGEVSG